jgi:hypothetical protein
MNNEATDGGIYLNGRTYAQHCAWIDAMSPDEKLILHCPIGDRYLLVMVSITKRWLMEKMPDQERLKLLEHLDKMTQLHWLTHEHIAAIEPMCDQAFEIAIEAAKLGSKKGI